MGIAAGRVFSLRMILARKYQAQPDLSTLRSALCRRCNNRIQNGATASGKHLVSHPNERATNELGFLQHQVNHFIFRKILICKSHLFQAGAASGEDLIYAGESRHFPDLGFTQRFFEVVAFCQFKIVLQEELSRFAAG